MADGDAYELRRRAAIAFGQRREVLGVRSSTGARRHAGDNTIAERWFAIIECGLLSRHKFATHAAAGLVLFLYIER